MFTGLVEDLGTVVALTPLPRGSGQRLRLRARLLEEPMKLGDSLAVDGVCLTVVTMRPGEVEVEAGPETLSRTTLDGLAVGQRVNLERALRLGDRLGGHLVEGHVDGVGVIAQSARRGDSWDVTFACPASILRYVVEKGAIAIDGVSLTVNRVDAKGFSVSLVPYTQERITLHQKAVGQRVNLEVDMIGKYVEKLLMPYLPNQSAHQSSHPSATNSANQANQSDAPGAPHAENRGGLTLEKLKENGFV